MKPCSLLLLLWVLAFSVQSQSPYPGGVAAPFQWYFTDSSLNTPTFHSVLRENPNIPVPHGTLTQLNFHPTLVVDGLSLLQVELGTRDLHNASYFTVYQSLDTTNENTIWHIMNGQQTSLVLTTSRMADLPAYKYMNYTDVVKGQPKVNSYVQHKQKDSLPVSDQWWNLGTKPVSPALPVSAFKGLIPEIIAYDRVLSTQERLKVATYLSLKYGITLTEPGATYLNSAGETIWDGYDYATWHHNIAGICRDDTAGLNQTAAGSSNTPGLMTMTTTAALTDKAFLLWGDNAKALTPAPKVAGLPLMLQKTWLMKPFGGTTPFTTSTTINTNAVDAPLPVQPVYWLVVDPSGQGKFSTTSQFVRMDALDEHGIASFNKITWDSDGSGKDVWGLIVAKDLLLVTDIDQPTCASPQSGALHTKIIGGQAPYQLALQNSKGLFITKNITDITSITDITGLSFAKYFLTVTDAQGRTYSDSLYLNDQDAPLPQSLAASYTLPPAGFLQLDASTNMPDGLTWQWTGPGNFESLSPQVTISTPGLYSLTCSKDGCSTEQDITVTATHNNALYDVTVYPNPSPAAFTARVNLDNPAQVTMTVYTQDGRLVSIQKGDERSNYYFTGTLTTGGVYTLVFVSGLSNATKRIIITK
jgi:hypothetical protein